MHATMRSSLQPALRPHTETLEASSRKFLRNESGLRSIHRGVKRHPNCYGDSDEKRPLGIHQAEIGKYPKHGEYGTENVDRFPTDAIREDREHRYTNSMERRSAHC